jgi:hypothetical protein
MLVRFMMKRIALEERRASQPDNGVNKRRERLTLSY